MSAKKKDSGEKARSRQASDASKRSIFMEDPSGLFIVTDETDPRFDTRAVMPLDPGLLANIESAGVIETVICCKRDGKKEVLDGRQRVRCARKVNETRRGEDKMLVPVFYRPANDDSAATFIQDSGNIHVADTILAKARKAQHRLTVLNRPEEEVARRFGVTTSAIKTWLRLLECIPAAQKAVDEGRAPLKEVIEKVGKLEHGAQAKALAEIVDRRAAPAGEKNGSGKTNGAATKTKSGRPPMGALKKYVATKVELVGEDAAWLDGVRFATGALQAAELLKQRPNLAAVLSPPEAKADEGEAA